MKLSAIITAHNEGDEVRETIKSIRETTKDDYEIVVIDDASTDGCCHDIEVDHIETSAQRRGIGLSRLSGASRARGRCLIFMDAHHRFSDGCLNDIADVALEHKAITTPCVGGLNKKPLKGHGFFLSTSRDVDNKKGVVGVHWNSEACKDRVSRCYGANVPYAIPRLAFDAVRWPHMSSGYGGNEAAVAVRAWFAEIDFLHVCGPWARHLYRSKDASPFPHHMPEWWRSHALTIRICFSRSSWDNYWLPHVFAGKIDEAELNGEDVMGLHEDFKMWKKRTDASFFRGLFHEQVPEGVTE
jgi:glycosyltransferase involved in cell wall biosynthesis